MFVQIKQTRYVVSVRELLMCYLLREQASYLLMFPVIAL